LRERVFNDATKTDARIFVKFAFHHLSLKRSHRVWKKHVWKKLLVVVVEVLAVCSG